MRRCLLAASVMFAGLSSSAALADDKPPAAPAPAAATPAPAASPARKVPLRVVRMLTETNQALLFDKQKGTHVLVDIGTKLEGFVVDDIDEDTVTLSPVEGGAQLVLAGPDPSWRRHREATTSDAAADERPARTKVRAPAATADDSHAAPIDPYGDPALDTVRTVEAPDAAPIAAPITAGEGGVRTIQAPGSHPAAPAVSAPSIPPSIPPPITPSIAAPTPTAPVAAPIVDTSSSAAWSGLPDPTATALAGTITDGPPVRSVSTTKPTKPAKPGTTTPAVTTAPTPAPAATKAATGAAVDRDGFTVIPRADVDAALKNFGALANAVHGSFVASGARIDAVAPDSLFAKAGLRAGDTILSINHEPLRSIDDAANLYASAGRLRTATIQLERAGKPLTLQISIQ